MKYKILYRKIMTIPDVKGSPFTDFSEKKNGEKR